MVGWHFEQELEYLLSLGPLLFAMWSIFSSNLRRSFGSLGIQKNLGEMGGYNRDYGCLYLQILLRIVSSFAHGCHPLQRMVTCKYFAVTSLHSCCLSCPVFFCSVMSLIVMRSKAVRAMAEVHRFWRLHRVRWKTYFMEATLTLDQYILVRLQNLRITW